MPDLKYTPEKFRLDNNNMIQAADDWAAYYAWVNVQYTREVLMNVQFINDRVKIIEETMKNKP